MRPPTETLVYLSVCVRLLETHTYLHKCFIHFSVSFLTVGMRGELGRCAVVFVPAIQLIRDGGDFNSSNWLYQLLARENVKGL